MADILLVEDDTTLAERVARALVSWSGEAWRVRHEGSIAAARAAVAAQCFDLGVVDLGLTDGSGIDLIRALTRNERPLRVLALTIFDDRDRDRDRVMRALGPGAVGYLLKDEPPERAVTQIGECLDGHFPVSSRVARYLFELCWPREPAEPLTRREDDVLACLARGDAYAECARSLGISLGTVQTHVKNLYRKLDVNTRADAAAWTAQRRSSTAAGE